MKRNSKPKSTPRTVRNLAELARVEGVSRATATRWNRDGAVSWNEDGTIDVLATRRLFREIAGPTKDPAIREARLRILEVEARLRTLRLQERERALLPVQDYEDSLTEVFGAIRGNISALVPTTAQMLMTLDRNADDFRTLCIATDRHLKTLAYNLYLRVRVSLAIASGVPSKKALKIAAKAWRDAFPDAWQEKGNTDEKSLLEEIESGKKNASTDARKGEKS